MDILLKEMSGRLQMHGFHDDVMDILFKIIRKPPIMPSHGIKKLSGLMSCEKNKVVIYDGA